MTEREEPYRYQIEVPPDLWERFRKTVDKSETINKAIVEMIKERCDEAMV